MTKRTKLTCAARGCDGCTVCAPTVEPDDERALLERVVEAARALEAEYDGGCQCGYFDEVDDEGEAVMSSCGSCATKDRLAALDVYRAEKANK